MLVVPENPSKKRSKHKVCILLIIFQYASHRVPTHNVIGSWPQLIDLNARHSAELRSERARVLQAGVPLLPTPSNRPSSLHPTHARRHHQPGWSRQRCAAAVTWFWGHRRESAQPSRDHCHARWCGAGTGSRGPRSAGPFPPRRRKVRVRAPGSMLICFEVLGVQSGARVTEALWCLNHLASSYIALVPHCQ
jgi:hypothetical protein